MFIQRNVNPLNRSVGDCVIRAISTAEEEDWNDTFIDLMIKCYSLKDIPSSNAAWGAYLHDLGYSRYIIPDTCPDCYTIRDFAEDNPSGTFIVATGSHVVAVIDGNWIDSFDSGGNVATYFFVKES